MNFCLTLLDVKMSASSCGMKEKEEVKDKEEPNYSTCVKSLIN